MSDRTEKKAATRQRVTWILLRLNKCSFCGGLPEVEDRRYIQKDGRGGVTIKCGNQCCRIICRSSFTLAVRAWNRGG